MPHCQPPSASRRRASRPRLSSAHVSATRSQDHLRFSPRTGRLVVIDEAPLSCGVASEISATVAEEGFEYLRSPIARVTRPDIPVPFSKPLEDAITPNVEKVIAASDGSWICAQKMLRPDQADQSYGQAAKQTTQDAAVTKILHPLVGDNHRRVAVDIHQYLRDLILSNVLSPETILSQVEVATCLKPAARQCARRYGCCKRRA